MKKALNYYNYTVGYISFNKVLRNTVYQPNMYLGYLLLLLLFE